MLHAGGYVVVGAAVAATVNVVVPRAWIDTLAGNLLVSIIVLAVFAVIVAICSEADAFVAASMSAFPVTARLVFMVVGPVLDVKLFALQIATFRRRVRHGLCPAHLCRRGPRGDRHRAGTVLMSAPTTIAEVLA